MYYIYGAENSRACEKAETLLIVCRKPYKIFCLGRDYTHDQLQKLVPGTVTVPHVFLHAKYIGGVKELYDHLYTHISFENEKENEKD